MTTTRSFTAPAPAALALAQTRATDRYTWTAGVGGAALATTAADGTRIELWLNTYHWAVKPEFVVHLDGGRVASTDSPTDWAEIERYIPRAEWPHLTREAGHDSDGRPDLPVCRAVGYRQRDLDVEYGDYAA